MIIDLVALLLVVALSFLGWRSGLVRQVVHWLALAGASMLAPPFGVALMPHLQPHLKGFPEWVVPTAALFAAWLTLFLVFDLGGIILHRVLKAMGKDSVVSRMNSLGGGVFGGLKGVVLVLVLATGMHMLRQPLVQAFPVLDPLVGRSRVIGVVEQHNPLVTLVERWREQQAKPPAEPVDPPAPQKGARGRGGSMAKGG